jgi:hypothetical protein
MAENADCWPDFVTHYYRQRPFCTLTDLDAAERARVIGQLDYSPGASRRFHSSFYFEQRLRYEALMFEQFSAKGGRPVRRHPHYAVLGESEIWAAIAPRSIRIPLARLESAHISFTYTDSWSTYVDRDLKGNAIPRKRQYGTVYRLEELRDLFARFGWPGERWKTEAAWEHDLYVEAQIWSDEAIAHLAAPE